jgi:hypothetical protein
MDGLPEDQRDDDEDSRSSSGSPSTPEERAESPQHPHQQQNNHHQQQNRHQHHQEEGAAAFPLQELVLAPSNPDHVVAPAAPLLLRHASISSLDESSQKYKTSVSTFSDGGLFEIKDYKFLKHNLNDE